MEPLSSITPWTLGSVRFVLTDMDETLTYQGRLSTVTYDALERLQSAGVKVIPVTAAPAGWCDQMARMWPIDGVIAENGGMFLQRHPDGRGITRRFWHSDAEQQTLGDRLASIADQIRQSVPGASLADDQPFRLTSLAFIRPQSNEGCQVLLAALREAGANATLNNLWVLGWLGPYDKLAMSKRILASIYDLDVDRDGAGVLYCGDSENDAPMFAFFDHTVGVRTVRHHLDRIPTPPRWITNGPGGSGFVEVADAVLAARFHGDSLPQSIFSKRRE